MEHNSSNKNIGNESGSKNGKRTVSRCITAVCALAGLCAVLAIGAIVQCQRLTQAERTLRAGYENSLYCTMDGLNTVYNELCKAELTADRNYKRELYREISAQAGAVLPRIAQLPISQSSIQNSEQLLNHISDYCGFLAKNEQEQQEEKINIAALRESCGKLYAALDGIDGNLRGGADVFSAEEAAKTDTAWQQAEADGVSYPALIYDGPFSQAEDIGRARTERPEATQQEAARTLAAFMDDPAFQGRSEGKIPVYIFAQNEKSAAVTVRGGLLLWYIDAGEQPEGEVSVQQARQAAQSFLEAAGYQGFEAVFSSSTSQSVVFNFTPLLEEAAVYPDLVKVRVSLSSGRVIGFEGTEYVVNNRERKPEEPTVMPSQAREKLSSELSVERVRLSIVPKGNSEVLAWEFYCLKQEDKYVVYIDAKTGSQVQMFRIINTDNGEMVI